MPGRIAGPLDPKIALVPPERLQWIEGRSVRPLLRDARGHAVLARIGDRPIYILADPDPISNHGLRYRANAAGAFALLAALRPNADAIGFDLTLHGFARSRNLLKLMFEPPFLALTLSLLAAALLAGLHGLGRFGPARHPARAIPFGKRALVDNAAALIRRARREHRLGERYAALIRDDAARTLRAPPGLGGRELDAWLDCHGRREGPAFSQLAEAATWAADATTMRSRAAALFAWRKDAIS